MDAARIDRWRPLAPLALAAAILVVYAPTLAAGWLDYDDDWLIRDNPFLARPSLAGLVSMWTDLSRATRLALGAEYLPIRDTSEWLVAATAGVDPLAHRIVDLAIYLGGCLIVRAWMITALPGRRWVAELAAVLFALHPVHAESVAWMAGRKDVLSLLFVAIALRAYASGDPRVRRAVVPIACALAMLSKASAVIVPLMLLAHDALARRRPDPIAVGVASAVGVLALALHLHVGAVVGMLAELPGGSRLSAIATMGPVVARYLGLALGAVSGSIEHDVPERSLADPVALGAWLLLGALAALALVAQRRGDRIPLVALALFAIPLLPVSQVLAPLQNRMADRYLLLAVIGPCLLLAHAIALLPPRAARLAAAGVIVVSAMLGVSRALTFADPIALWVEASEQAPASPLGPYQLAMAVRGQDPVAAEGAFREAIRRDRLTTETGRRAANNLAILLVSAGMASPAGLAPERLAPERLAEAIAILEQASERYPDDPRVRFNLAELYGRIGREEDAGRLRSELRTRFPSWRPGFARGGPEPSQ